MTAQAPPSPNPAAQDAADARAFDDYARRQDPVQVQAALWATRRTEGLDAAAQAAFQTWLQADPQHAQAYADMAESLSPVRALPDNAVQALRAGLQVGLRAGLHSPAAGLAAAPAAHRPPPAAPSHRAWLTGLGRWLPQAAVAVGVVALVGGGWLGWDHWRSQPTFAQHYATKRGQQLTVSLPDGSTLALDAATQAQVRLYRQRREVRLSQGQAMFTVQANPEQAFDVWAGAVRVTVVGTRFSVRHARAGMDAGKTVVAVESGRVQVSGDSGRVELGAGQGVTADATGRLQPIAQLAAGSVAAWRKGRISFNDTPLAEALAELERYGDTGLVVRDPAVGALRLGGSFDLRQTGAFAQALPALLPVRLESRNGVMEIVGRR